MFCHHAHNVKPTYGKVSSKLSSRNAKIAYMETTGDRVKKARKVRGLTQQDLARAAGISRAAISQWESGEAKSIRSSNLLAVAKRLAVSPSWLDSGKGNMDDLIQEEPTQLYHAPPIGGKVPLVSWVQAGSMVEVEDPHAPGVAEDWITTTVQVRDHTFALRVRGDSMEPEFPDGMIIIIEPDMQYENGDFVVVRNTSDEATFKQLVQDGSDWYLKPVNPRYPIKPLGDAEIVGVVREAVKKYR